MNVQKFGLTERAVNEIIEEIKGVLQKSGLYFRIFGRVKSGPSIEEKIKRKGYRIDGKHMQDIIGVRITLYFSDDVLLCQKIIEQSYDVVDISKTTAEPEKFCPERLNLVCSMRDKISDQFDNSIWKEYPIDKTFEVQIRTVFSEGWHEVEHDIRYKSIADWSEYPELSRNLNGVFATLETCDWAMLSIINNLAYQQYKKKQWAQMIKTKMRIHLQDDKLSGSIVELLNENQEIAKQFFRADRSSVLLFMACDLKKNVPLTLDNIVYIINACAVKNTAVANLAPSIIQARLPRICD